MGMAASQARFLGLTARKSNVEYEGQQINQQRTTLSNQSANYYSNLLGMSVPVPPSVDDYTRVVYTFDDGALTNTITSLIAQQNGMYTLSYLSQYVDDFTPVSAATSVVNKSGNDYYVGSVQLRKLGDSIPRDPNGLYTGNPPDEYLSSLSKEQLDALELEEQTYEALLNEKYGTQQNGWMVRYSENTSNGVWSPFFYKMSDLDGANVQLDPNGNIISAVNCYTMGTSTKTVEIKNIENCRVEKDSTGRYISISIPEIVNLAGVEDTTETSPDGTTPPGGEPGVDPGVQVEYVTYSLTTSTITDQDAYDDAMNQYEYDKYLYDQSIQEINAQIEIIQSQDKNLELRLKQLDTEQSAISTEMDAVEKVIEKNTESSFKTFG